MFFALRGGPIPTLYLKTFNIFFSGPDFRKIYQCEAPLHESGTEWVPHAEIFLFQISVWEKYVENFQLYLSHTCGFLCWHSVCNEHPHKRRGDCHWVGVYRYILYAFDYLTFQLNRNHPRGGITWENKKKRKA